MFFFLSLYHPGSSLGRGAASSLMSRGLPEGTKCVSTIRQGLGLRRQALNFLRCLPLCSQDRDENVAGTSREVSMLQGGALLREPCGQIPTQGRVVPGESWVALRMTSQGSLQGLLLSSGRGQAGVVPRLLSTSTTEVISPRHNLIPFSPSGDRRCRWRGVTLNPALPLASSVTSYSFTILKTFFCRQNAN